jgi:ubiquinone/menaquinone biosynthesis C-methylase UbiE
MTMETIRNDFDRLATIDTGGWNHNDHYHPYLLRHIPEPCGDSLEIGCGTGTFARLLGERSRHVLALDLSPEMVQIAQERSKDFQNVDYRVANVLEWPFPVEGFDCIASIATLHHLPLEEMLAKMKSALKPGGVLLILDLHKAKSLSDYLLRAVAIPVNILVLLAKTGRLRPSQAERWAWDEHVKHDHYLHVPAVRLICQELLPGAVVKVHLFWRYSIIWRKPAA